MVINNNQLSRNRQILTLAIRDMKYLIRADQMRANQIRGAQIRANQIRTDQIRADQLSPTKYLPIIGVMIVTLWVLFKLLDYKKAHFENNKN